MVKMNPYPNTCSYCNSPAQRNKNVLLCSNTRCKSWKKIRKLSANVDHSKIKQGQGLTSDDPIIIICPICNDKACCRGLLTSAYCWKCGESFSYIYIIGRWYFSMPAGSSKYKGYILLRQDDLSSWSYKTEIKI